MSNLGFKKIPVGLVAPLLAHTSPGGAFLCKMSDQLVRVPKPFEIGQAPAARILVLSGPGYLSITNVLPSLGRKPAPVSLGRSLVVKELHKRAEMSREGGVDCALHC